VNWRNRGAEITNFEAAVGRRRFAAFIPIPKRQGSIVPSLFQQRKYQYTVFQGGRSWGNARLWQPVRAT